MVLEQTEQNRIEKNGFALSASELIQEHKNRLLSESFRKETLICRQRETIVSYVRALATARIQIKSSIGDFKRFGAVIDSGSQSTIISAESTHILKLQKIKSLNRDQWSIFHWKVHFKAKSKYFNKK